MNHLYGAVHYCKCPRITGVGYLFDLQQRAPLPARADHLPTRPAHCSTLGRQDAGKSGAVCGLLSHFRSIFLFVGRVRSPTGQRGRPVGHVTRILATAS